MPNSLHWELNPKGPGLKIKRTWSGVKFYHFLAEWPWGGHFTSLSLSFHICKMGVTVTTLPISEDCSLDRITWSMWKWFVNSTCHTNRGACWIPHPGFPQRTQDWSSHSPSALPGQLFLFSPSVFSSSCLFLSPCPASFTVYPTCPIENGVLIL